MKAKISGLSIRYDVPTKCTLVSLILTKQYKTNDELTAFINEQAAKFHINPLTVKNWISTYYDCYRLGMQLPAGVMSHSFTTINTPTDLKQTIQALAEIKSSLNNLKQKKEKINHPQYARPKHRQTSTEVLTGLFAKA